EVEAEERVGVGVGQVHPAPDGPGGDEEGTVPFGLDGELEALAVRRSQGEVHEAVEVAAEYEAVRLRQHLLAARGDAERDAVALRPVAPALDGVAEEREDVVRLGGGGGAVLGLPEQLDGSAERAFEVAPPIHRLLDVAEGSLGGVQEGVRVDS